MGSIIELKDVRKSYQTPTPFQLEIPDLRLPQGCLAAIVGPSGSGKSTLLNLVSGLDSPDAGTIRVADTELNGLSASELTRFRAFRLGFIFQSHNLFPTLTSLENVEITSLMRGDRPSEARERALQALRDVGLEAYEKSFPRQLSGGQQQRVAVARALATEPAVLVADEPTASLDSKTANSVIDLLEDLNRKKGTSIIFSTHDPRILERAVLKLSVQDGRILPN